MSANKKELGEVLLKLRQDRAMRQVDVAKKAGINPMLVGRYERGVSSPTITNLAKIATAFNMSISDILAI